MQLIILAGGLGTRMHPLTEDLPKALIPVAGKPFAFHQIEWLADHGVTDLVFCIGRHGDQMRAALGDGASWGVRVRYVDDGARLLGTAGALRHAIDAGVVAERFAVQYGDSYLPVDLEAFFVAFETCGLPAMMAVYRNEARSQMNNVDYAEGRVLLHDKRPQRPSAAHIDYGISAFRRDLVQTRVASGEVADLSDLTRALSVEGLLAGYEVTEPFHEVGSPEGLAEMERFLEARRA